MSELLSISQSAAKFIDSTALARSANTARTYKNGIAFFLQVLRKRKVNPDTLQIARLTEDAVSWMAEALKTSSPSTERLYLTVLARFFDYLAADNLAAINLPRVRLLIQQRARKPGQRLPQFPRDLIERVLIYAETLIDKPADHNMERLRNLRDRAFLLTLADTGLRVHEACNLRRGEIDWNEGRALVIGKGNRQAIVRFSRRSQASLKDYLSLRAHLDGASGKPLTSLPLFARHDNGAGKKIKPMTPTTGRNVVNQRVFECLGEEAVGSITPHSFRHYFVTRVLVSSGNIKLAQVLARHQNIAVTQRYAHLSDNELDQGYWEVFEEQNGRKEDS